MSADTVFVKSMVEHFPGLAPVLEEHISNFGELLPHVLLGDITRYVLALYTRGSAGGVPFRLEVREILDFLEDSFVEGNQEVRELISVSFLENLPRPGENGSQIGELLGEQLRKQLSIMG